MFFVKKVSFPTAVVDVYTKPLVSIYTPPLHRYPIYFPISIGGETRMMAKIGPL